MNCSFSFFFFIIKLFFRLKLPKLLLLIHYILVIYSFNLHHLLLLRSGDTEINPDPMKSSRLNFCHWNLNGIATHDFVKVTLLEAFIKANNINIICLSETFLDSAIALIDERLNECIVTEITVSDEKCFLTCLYKSPNQNQEQFESFCKNLIDVLSHINNQQPTCSILVGDFNAKLSKWCPGDKDRKAGQDIDTFRTTSGCTQMIGLPTHIMNDKWSCIDLLFTTNSKLLCDVGVEQTIYSKCHRNIIYGSLNLNIPLSPP